MKTLGNPFIQDISFGSHALCQFHSHPLMNGQGPGGKQMIGIDWAGVCALISIIALITIIGYREGHSIL